MKGGTNPGGNYGGEGVLPLTIQKIRFSPHVLSLFCPGYGDFVILVQFLAILLKLHSDKSTPFGKPWIQRSIIPSILKFLTLIFVIPR